MSDGNHIRANVRMKFYTRFALLGVAALAVAGWFFKDGLLTWPHQNMVWEAYNELKPASDAPEDHAHEEHDDKPHEHAEDFPQEEWETVIAENDWSAWVHYQEVDADEEGEKAKRKEARQPLGRLHSDFELQFQIILGAICIPVGLAFLLKVFLARGMWIESDGEAVTSSWGKGFRFEDVEEINKKKWRDKGLAYVRFRGEDGKAKTFVIDDLKFHRKPTDTILYELEQAVGVDKIVGGIPEPDPNAPPEQEMETGEDVASEEAATAE